MVNQIKCAHCNKWTPASEELCVYCKHEHYASSKKEKEDLGKIPLSGIPLIKIYEEDSTLVKILKYIVRGGQLIFFIIISIISYMASSVVH